MNAVESDYLIENKKELETLLAKQKLEERLAEKKEEVQNKLNSYKILLNHRKSKIEKENNFYIVDGEGLGWPGPNVLGRAFRIANIDGLDQAKDMPKGKRTEKIEKHLQDKWGSTKEAEKQIKNKLDKIKKVKTKLNHYKTTEEYIKEYNKKIRKIKKLKL